MKNSVTIPDTNNLPQALAELSSLDSRGTQRALEGAVWRRSSCPVSPSI